MSTPWSIVAADTLDDLLAVMQHNPGCRPLAGGTDLLVQKQLRPLDGEPCVDISRIPELAGISRTSAGDWRIGATTSYSQILADPVLCETFPMLARAAGLTGGWAIQNRGTLGGNLANASPAADSPPALMCYEAELELVGPSGSRQMPLANFFLDYRRTALRPGELIAAILVPARDPRVWHESYTKVGTREAQSIAKLSLAIALHLEDGIVHQAFLAGGALAPTCVRLIECETLLVGARLERALIPRLQDSLQRAIHPIDDLRSNEHYRRRVASALLERALRTAMKGTA